MSPLGAKVMLKGTRERATITKISYGLGGSKRYILCFEQSLPVWGSVFSMMGRGSDPDRYYLQEEFDFLDPATLKAGPVKPFEEV